MATELIEALVSLEMIVDEENDRLSAPGCLPISPELVTAKLRLAGIFEAESVRLTRGGRDWQAALDDEVREAVLRLVEDMKGKLDTNMALLARRTALCDDLMGAITREAKRLTGGTNTVYGVGGALQQTEQPTPISINSHI